MFFLPPDEFWYHTVARVAVTFDDHRSGIGTGFFVFDGENYLLITARHVVDPKYSARNLLTQSICSEVMLTFTSAINPGTPGVRAGYQRLLVTEPDFLFARSDVDLAILKVPSEVLPARKGEHIERPLSFAVSYLASSEDLAGRYAGEPVVFIGFPKNSPVQVVGDSEFHYPILRQGVFAYPPFKSITVEGELGRDYGLLDSFAQSGFSGGPVVSLQKGWADGSWHPKEIHRPPKVVGLICGHYRSRQDRADGGHAGLSFFARSTSILELITDCANSK